MQRGGILGSCDIEVRRIQGRLDLRDTAFRLLGGEYRAYAENHATQVVQDVKKDAEAAYDEATK